MAIGLTACRFEYEDHVKPTNPVGWYCSPQGLAALSRSHSAKPLVLPEVSDIGHGLAANRLPLECALLEIKEFFVVLVRAWSGDGPAEIHQTGMSID